MKNSDQLLVDMYAILKSKGGYEGLSLAAQLEDRVQAILKGKEHVSFPLSDRRVFVDVADLDLVLQHCWSLDRGNETKFENGTVYARTGCVTKSGRRGSIGMHRIIINPADDMMVDHINHNGLDNRRCNLREVTAAKNTYNRRSKVRKRDTKFVGVYQEAKGWRMIFKQTVDGEKLSINKSYGSEVAAAEAYNELAIKYRGEHAHLNIITDEDRERSELDAKARKKTRTKMAEEDALHIKRLLHVEKLTPRQVHDRPEVDASFRQIQSIFYGQTWSHLTV